MTAVADAAAALATALATVDGIRVSTDPATSIDLATAIIGPPSLTWEAFAQAPTTAFFPIYLVLTNTDSVVDELWALLEPITAAIDAAELEASVQRADPGTFNAGGTELPSYEIQIEVSLQ
ncbi:MAG TPA: hypothetical protein VHA75_06965 [Rugosimonospora sp.]|nr:hypothetical protein [Rugosimonospora sp.]